MRYEVERSGRNGHHGSSTCGEVFQRYALDGPDELEWLAILANLTRRCIGALLVENLC